MLLTEIENHNLSEMADVLANAPKLPMRSIKIIKLFQVAAPPYLTKIKNFRKSFVICFRQGIKTPTKGLDKLVKMKVKKPEQKGASGELHTKIRIHRK